MLGVKFNETNAWHRLFFSWYSIFIASFTLAADVGHFFFSSNLVIGNYIIFGDFQFHAADDTNIHLTIWQQSWEDECKRGCVMKLNATNSKKRLIEHARMLLMINLAHWKYIVQWRISSVARTNTISHSMKMIKIRL